MTLLIDSHVLIWMLYEPTKIGTAAADSIHAARRVAISVVSFWELTLKHLKGKLPYAPEELVRGANVLNLAILELRSEHVPRLADVNLSHGDPFDRMLVAQALAENAVLMTSDRNLLESKYETLAAR